jgi:gag-polyprotein putative aspartyl protease
VEIDEKVISLRCNIKINDTEIQAIIDTGAATNIISNKLLDKLGLEIQESSGARFTIANGEKAASLGKTEIEIEIGDWIIPITVEVIESRNKDLIIGTKTLAEYKGNINLRQKIMTLKDDEEQIEVPIYYTNLQPIIEEETEEEEESENDEEFPDEFEDIQEEIEANTLKDLHPVK